MVNIYANPELLPMFELWVSNLMIINSNFVKEFSNRDKLISIFIESLDTGSYVSLEGSRLWQSFDEQYGKDPDYQWWSEGKQLTIYGLEGLEANEESPYATLRQELEFRIRTDSKWDVPLFDWWDREFYSYRDGFAYTAIMAINTPNSLRHDGAPVFKLLDSPTYVKSIYLFSSYLNSIYFTLNPNEPWPKQNSKPIMLNYPRGIK